MDLSSTLTNAVKNRDKAAVNKIISNWTEFDLEQRSEIKETILHLPYPTNNDDFSIKVFGCYQNSFGDLNPGCTLECFSSIPMKESDRVCRFQIWKVEENSEKIKLIRIKNNIGHEACLIVENKSQVTSNVINEINNYADKILIAIKENHRYKYLSDLKIINNVEYKSAEIVKPIEIYFNNEDVLELKQIISKRDQVKQKINTFSYWYLFLFFIFATLLFVFIKYFFNRVDSNIDRINETAYMNTTAWMSKYSLK